MLVQHVVVVVVAAADVWRGITPGAYFPAPAAFQFSFVWGAGGAQLTFSYLFVGFYWWARICLRIYRIYKQKIIDSGESFTPPQPPALPIITSSSIEGDDVEEKSIAFQWAVKFWRQLLWILVNLYLYTLLL